MYKLLCLTDFEMRQLAKPVLAILIFLLLAQQVLLGIAAEKYYNYIPYEEFFASSGAIIVFYLAFAACCGACLLSVLYNYHDSKSIYTLMTLPQDRRLMYFSKLLSGLLAFLLLICTQLASAVLGYMLFAPRIRVVIQEPIIGATVHFRHAVNGLFLAFVRSDFFRLVFPLGPESLISTMAILISFLCGLYYAIYCERSKKYARISLFAAQIGYCIYLINYRINAREFFTQSQNLYIHSLILILAAGYFMWSSIRLIRRSAVS
jgi:hypothetical protein